MSLWKVVTPSATLSSNPEKCIATGPSPDILVPSEEASSGQKNEAMTVTQQTRTFPFQQVDVFSSKPLKGNPLAVVAEADALTAGEMAAVAQWTNLSETTFLLQPTHPDADYRVRIFTPLSELPFAGHPTLGSCHAWLSSLKSPVGEFIVQECEAGLIRIRRENQRLYFAAPEFRRSGPIEPDTMDRVLSGLLLTPNDIMAASWVDNGPGWLAVMLASRAKVLALRPNFSTLAGMRVGVVAPWDAPAGDKQSRFRGTRFHSVRP
jgi:PhzF family phenazine biosynthesis protein